MAALAALLEQLQPLPALRRCRRGEPAQAGKMKEAAAGEGEQLSWSDQKCKVRKHRLYLAFEVWRDGSIA